MNLKWRDAMQIAGYAFEKNEQAAGWPDRLNAEQLAALQRPRYFTPVKRMMEPDPHDPVANAQIEQNRANNVLREALRDEFEAGHGPDTPEKFSVWLSAQGDPPSTHIQAWFDAVGVTHSGAQNEPTETLEQRDLRWLEHYESEVTARGNRGAVQRSAAHFGVNRSTFGRAIKGAREDRAERYRSDFKAIPKKGKATPFDGLTVTVRDGKKSGFFINFTVNFCAILENSILQNYWSEHERHSVV